MATVARGFAATGLSEAEARRRLTVSGRNTLPTTKGTGHWQLFLHQFTHFFALMLWVAAALAVVADLPELGIAIIIVVIVNALFAFAQEYRAGNATKKLQALLPIRATVVRDGRPHELFADELVVGDVVLLTDGDRISADLNIVVAEGIAIDESMLTGESAAVRRGVGDSLYAGTFVLEGEATTVVAATGRETKLAAIAITTGKAHPPPSPLALRLSRVVRTVAILAVMVGTGCFLIALALGTPATEGFLFAVGVTVALVPEGLLPTVTLSLARAARLMASHNALVRRLEAVETLGSTTYICSDKTGTLTQNRMSVVEVWTPSGDVALEGQGYEPNGTVDGSASALDAATRLARSALICSRGRARKDQSGWVPVGDPMEAALHVLAMRLGLPASESDSQERIFPFDARRRRESAIANQTLHVKGAPEAVVPLCDFQAGASVAVHEMAHRGLRVLAVAQRGLRADEHKLPADQLEHRLTLLGLVGIEDPPREGVADALAQCFDAGIRVAMVTGDHPETARAIATEIGLISGEDATVTVGSELPSSDAELAGLLEPGCVVVARVIPEDKLRIARVLHAAGHVVAMTGDGVNDGPALREADIGIAMGRSGTDVAREAADLVLLDDHFATIVTAVALGRATFLNMRRFLSYHLTDNVAELAPFVIWSLSGGNIPLALTVLQVLALDIATDLLPALALGSEPPNKRVLSYPPVKGELIDRRVIARVFGVLGPSEAIVEMVTFLGVLIAGGWWWGQTPSVTLLATASGAAFAAVVLGQSCTAFAVRSASLPIWRIEVRNNKRLIAAVGVQLMLLVGFLAIPAISDVLGGSWPNLLGWSLALLSIPAVFAADAGSKAWRKTRLANATSGSGPYVASRE